MMRCFISATGKLYTNQENGLRLKTQRHVVLWYVCREEEMQELNRATNTKMAWFSFLSLGVCLSVAGLQFWHLKTFFQKKKLI